MSVVAFGNHSSVIVPRQDRDSIRKFYCDVLGGKITKEENERDFLRLGENFHIGFLYGDVPDESEFLRTARSVWLEIKSDNVEEISRKIVRDTCRTTKAADGRFGPQEDVATTAPRPSAAQVSSDCRPNICR
jgi:hypothetical protein